MNERRYEQVDISPEQELRPAVCEQRLTEIHIYSVDVLKDDDAVRWSEGNINRVEIMILHIGIVELLVPSAGWLCASSLVSLV